MKQELMTTVNKVGFVLKKHSPEILAVVGVIGVVTSAVMACKATTKVNDILDEHKEKMDEINDMPTPEDNNEATTEFAVKLQNKAKVQVYAHTCMAFAKLYGPAVCLGTLSLGALLGSNDILRKRNSALAAAYMTIDQSFKKYRSRVVERFGDEVEKQIFYNMQPTEVEETVTDEKGKEKKTKKVVNVVNPEDTSDYVKYLTRANSDWSENEDFIMMTLNGQQSYLNDLLRAKGYLTLNQVYETLGFKSTKAGMVVGWIYDKKNPTGDNYVEFDVHKVSIPNEFGEYETAYAIDFNVDGNIYNQMI